MRKVLHRFCNPHKRVLASGVGGQDFSPAIMNLKKDMFRLVYIKLILRGGDQNEYRKVLHFFFDGLRRHCRGSVCLCKA